MLLYEWNLYTVWTEFVHCTNGICTLYERNLYTVQMEFVHCTNGICTLYEWNLYTVWMEFIHCTNGIRMVPMLSNSPPHVCTTITKRESWTYIPLLKARALQPLKKHLKCTFLCMYVYWAMWAPSATSFTAWSSLAMFSTSLIAYVDAGSEKTRLAFSLYTIQYNKYLGRQVFSSTVRKRSPRSQMPLVH